MPWDHLSDEMEIVGYIFAALAVAAFWFGLHTSYTTWGGVKGQIPILLFPLQPAVLLMISAGLLAKHIAWIQALPGWAMVIFPIMIVANGWLLLVVGRLGQRHEATGNN